MYLDLVTSMHSRLQPSSSLELPLCRDNGDAPTVSLEPNSAVVTVKTSAVDWECRRTCAESRLVAN